LGFASRAIARTRGNPANRYPQWELSDQLIDDDVGIDFTVSDPGKRNFAERLRLRLADAEPHRMRPIWTEVIGVVAHAVTIAP
jgi:hypothetical protein